MDSNIRGARIVTPWAKLLVVLSLSAVASWQPLSNWLTLVWPGWLILVAAGIAFHASRQAPPPDEPTCKFRQLFCRSALTALASPLILFSERPRSGVPLTLADRTFRLGYLFLLLLICQIQWGLIHDYIPSGWWISNTLHFLENSKWGLWAYLFSMVVVLSSSHPDGAIRVIRHHAQNRLDATWFRVLCAVGGIYLLLVLSKPAYWGMVLFLFALTAVFNAPYLLAGYLTWPTGTGYRLSPLDPLRKLGPWETLSLVFMLSIPYLMYTNHALRSLVSGELFSATFSQEWVGWGMDTTFLGTLFCRYYLTLASLLPLLSAMRWLADMRRPTTRYMLPILAALVLICYSSYLIVALYHLWLYFSAMGPTPLRVMGLASGLATAMGLAFFIRVGVSAPKPSGRE
jgi:hypothetical protein